MKAESIEQIREHIKKGGRVVFEPSLEIVSLDDHRYYFNDGGASGLHNLMPSQWLLLPLEEKEPVTLMGQLENAGVRAYYGNGEPEDYSTLPGLLGEALGKRISDAFKDHGIQKEKEDEK